MCLCFVQPYLCGFAQSTSTDAKGLFFIMEFRFSKHSLEEHQDEKWNAVTIRDAVESGRVQDVEILSGQAADILCGWVDGDFVGLVLGKEKDGVVVIVTGFAAPKEYWLSV